ncbi:DUF3027 domain-containing protein [Alloscardovia theropitheci]|uniref:DUF3027 domain-containing protein n=1 Tax=Alloscardovia theropitheci TaxID=2496842 RepID=A0A4R0QQM1_9BIFI|nr:DUF3027 domain-containing protein [Alloscardovia theropitheci]TCD53618.1 DUF3027 domain-containing protein [Alloscardovia theropitheci]
MTEPSYADTEFKPVQVDTAVIDYAHEALQHVADDESHVGKFIIAGEVADNVIDFRFSSHIMGYEGWQWSITLYHDKDADKWTINESSLIPTEKALLAPEWIPWKDRLIPSDISPTDVLGTDPDDARLESGASSTDNEGSLVTPESDDKTLENSGLEASEISADTSNVTDTNGGTTNTLSDNTHTQDVSFRKTVDTSESSSVDREGAELGQTSSDEIVTDDQEQQAKEIIEEFNLSRSRVLSPAGRSQTADRWYTGPHGPKSLSTKVAHGKTCQTCGFFVQIQGELGTMFGVCANKWSQDDGRVVSVDHGCGEHSDIEPPTPTAMWIQPDPAVDDDDEIIIISRPQKHKPTVEERRIADILEDVDDPENLTENSASDNNKRDDASSSQELENDGASNDANNDVNLVEVQEVTVDTEGETTVIATEDAEDTDALQATRQIVDTEESEISESSASEE